MGKRESYPPGTFCWPDLATTDAEAAKAFYGGLFGWVAEDMPVGDGVFYSMMRLDGADVAAIAPQPPGQAEAGVPPAWQNYVSVESADAACDLVAGNGGHVHAPAFDVMEAGRMAVLQDPQGAFFMAWQPGRHFGAALVNAPGALSWNELNTTDLDGAAAFYTAVFGWTIAPFESMPDYLGVKNGEASNGGIQPVAQPGIPAHWLAYFGIADIDAGLAKVTELGGTVHAGPIDIGIAKIGVAADPQGATFALYCGPFDD